MAKQKRILLINLSTMSVYSKPVVKVGVPLMPPLTLAVLAAPLMKKGFSVDVFDFNLTNLKRLEVFKKKLESFDPTHVAISVMTPSYNQLKEVASFIKDYNKNIVITAGGPHISVYPKQTLKETVIDISVRGEGDFILPKIIRGQNLKKLNSVYYKKNKKIVKGRVNVSSYLLSGLIKCGNCGSNFQGHQKVIKGKKYRYYVCGGYQSKGDFVCSQHYINAG